MVRTSFHELIEDVKVSLSTSLLDNPGLEGERERERESSEGMRARQPRNPGLEGGGRNESKTTQEPRARGRRKE